MSVVAQQREFVRGVKITVQDVQVAVAVEISRGEDGEGATIRFRVNDLIIGELAISIILAGDKIIQGIDKNDIREAVLVRIHQYMSFQGKLPQ